MNISKRRWLFLPVETKARELAAKTLLACVAAERGWGVIIGKKKTVRDKQELYPRGTFIEKSITPGRIAHIRKANAIGNRVSAWCEEGLIYLNREDYRQSRLEAESFAAIDYFFAWGKNQADDITSIMGPNDKIVLSGNPRFDLLRPEMRGLFAKSAAAIKQRYGKFILINTKFSMVNNNRKIEEFDYISFLRSIGKLKTKENEELVRRNVNLNKKLFAHFQDMLPLLSKQFSDHAIIIRPHPSENHEPWLEQAKRLPNVKVVFEGNVNEWLLAADVMIHNNCTTGVEAFLLERPAISYRPFKDEEVEHQLPNQVSYQAVNAEELIDLVSRFVEQNHSVSEEERAPKVSFARHYIANIDGKLACEIIMDTMDKVDLPLMDGIFPIDQGVSKILAKKVKNFERAIKQLFDASYRNRQRYNRQKFPGINLAEMKNLVAQLHSASGRFSNLQIIPAVDDTYCIFRP